MLKVTERQEFWDLVAKTGRLPLPGLNPWRTHRLLGMMLTRPGEVYKAKLKEGIWFHGRYRDFDTRMWATEDHWNRGLVAFICDRLKQRPGVFIDVGANLGVVSALTAHASKIARVISIEANPSTAEVARLTLEANGLANCQLLEVAVGDKLGILELRFNAFHSGNASLSPRKVKASDQVTKVQVTTLDHLVIEHDLNPVSVIKIDVEGFEPEVLQGSQALIKAHLPTIIMEFNEATKTRGYDFETLFGPLRSLGYRFSWLEMGTAGQWSLTPEAERTPEMTSEDVVCLPPDAAQ